MLVVISLWWLAVWRDARFVSRFNDSGARVTLRLLSIFEIKGNTPSFSQLRSKAGTEGWRLPHHRGERDLQGGRFVLHRRDAGHRKRRLPLRG